MSWSRNERRAEAAVFILALVLRLAWVGCIEHRGGALFGPDAPSYDAMAMNLLAGKGLEKEDYVGLFADPHRSLTVRAFRPPLLPVLLAGVYGLAGHRTWAARLVIALLSAATCVVVMRIARRLFDAPTAALAGLLTAVYPKFIYYGGEPVTETPCTFLLAVAVATLLKAQATSHKLEATSFEPRASGRLAARGSPLAASAARSSRLAARRFFAGGAALGLATLSRSSLLAFAPFAAVWVLASSLKPQASSRWRDAGLLLLGFVAAMSPWWARNTMVLGRFVPATTEGGYTFWVTNNDRADGGGHCFWPSPPGGFEGMSETEIDREFYRRGLAHVRSHPEHFVRLAGVKFIRFWRLWPHAGEPGVGLWAAIVGGMSFTPVLALAALGAVAARARWRLLLLFYLLFFYYTSLHMVYMAITRYRVPIEPYLIVLAAWGMVSLARSWGWLHARPLGDHSDLR